MHLCIIFAAQVFDFNIFVETVINHSKVWGKIKRVYIYIYSLKWGEDALNWSKVIENTFVMLKNMFQINVSIFMKNKHITDSTKILCSTTVFNIDNNQKCFLSSKSAYYYDFWRSCETEDWSNDAENTAAHHRNKFNFIIYSHRKQLF